MSSYRKMINAYQRYINSELVERLKTSVPFIQVLLGPRQVGKTTAIPQLAQKLGKKCVVVSADSVSPNSEQWLRDQWEKIHSIPEGGLFVIDEVQKIANWSSILKELFDPIRHSKLFNILLLGSASLSIQKGLTESLAGRFEVIPLYHWSLGEMDEAFQWDLDTFLKFGGYPAAAQLIHDTDRWQSFIRNSIIEPVLTRDIQLLAQINKPALFRQTFELAVRYPAQELSLQKILGQLQDQGNIATIKHYLELLEGGFLIKCLQKYSEKEIVIKGSSPKLLPLNTALIHAFVSPDRIDYDPEWYGRIFETAVGVQLSRLPNQLYYWREGKAEIDFVYQHERIPYGFEIKSSTKSFGKGRESFLKKFPHAKTILIDKEVGEEILRAKTVKEIIRAAKIIP